MSATSGADGGFGFDDAVDAIAGESRRLAGVVGSADLDARVPTTPKWSLRDLAHHVGTVQWYWSANVRAKNPDERSGGSLTPLPPDSDLLAWLGWCTYSLLSALRDAGPDSPCWAWWDAPAPHTAGAVARHQAQEVAVHRWDAEGSVGSSAPLSPELATDGVPEFIDVMVGPDGSALRGGVTLRARRHRRELAGRPRRGERRHRRAQRDRVGPRPHALPSTPGPRRRCRRGPDAGGVAPLPRRHVVTELTFLGTGNFLAPPGRYWNSFVLDSNVLVEPCPTALPHLRKCGFDPATIDVVVISHFHADHCFGWPFFLQAVAEAGGGRTLHIVGPPGLEAHLAHMIEVAEVRSTLQMAHERLDLRFIDVEGTWQEAGGLRFRAIEVEHVPYLRCFGYLFDARGSLRGLQRRRAAVRRPDRAGHRSRRVGARVQRGARRPAAPTWRSATSGSSRRRIPTPTSSLPTWVNRSTPRQCRA